VERSNEIDGSAIGLFSR